MLIGMIAFDGFVTREGRKWDAILVEAELRWRYGEATNITLRDCICAAFRVRDFQIVGPDWMTQAVSKSTPSFRRVRPRGFLGCCKGCRRIASRIRREMKEQNVHGLIVGTGGAKLKPAERKTDDNSTKAMGADGKPRPMMMCCKGFRRGTQSNVVRTRNYVELDSRYPRHLPSR